MKRTVKPFLDEIIDYAGLYPPASLELVDAFDTFLKHRNSTHSWLLSKFVIGSIQLKELGELLHKVPKKELPIELAIVAPATTEFNEFKQAITTVVKEVALLRSEEHTSELQSRPHLVCRRLLEKKKEHCYRCPGESLPASAPPKRHESRPWPHCRSRPPRHPQRAELRRLLVLSRHWLGMAIHTP